MPVHHSTMGWGAHLEGDRLQEKWEPQEQRLHINLLEMRALVKVLQGFPSLPVPQSWSPHGLGQFHHGLQRKQRSGRHVLCPSGRRRSSDFSWSSTCEFHCGWFTFLAKWISLLTCYLTKTRLSPQNGHSTRRLQGTLGSPHRIYLPPGVTPRFQLLCLQYQIPEHCGRHPLPAIAEPVSICFPTSSAPRQGPNQASSNQAQLFLVARAWLAEPWFPDLLKLSINHPWSLLVETLLRQPRLDRFQQATAPGLEAVRRSLGERIVAPKATNLLFWIAWGASWPTSRQILIMLTFMAQFLFSLCENLIL